MLGRNVVLIGKPPAIPPPSHTFNRLAGARHIHICRRFRCLAEPQHAPRDLLQCIQSLFSYRSANGGLRSLKNAAVIAFCLRATTG